MDRLDIEVAIGSISEPGLIPFQNKKEAQTLARKINEYHAKMVSDFPNRYGAFAVLPLPDMESALEEMAYALDVLKLDGVNLLSNYGDEFLGNDVFNTLFDELNRRKAVVHLHPSSPVPAFKRPQYAAIDFMEEFTFNTTRAATNLILGRTLERCPDVKIILAHGGGTLPYLKQRINLSQLFLEKLGIVENLAKPAAEQIGNFYFDTAIATADIALYGVKAITGIPNMLYGSDANYAPETWAEVMNDELANFKGFTTADYADVTIHNAIKLFPRLANLKAFSNDALFSHD
jgi:predicted TIM-barrel fold metal-dependent hydrolase